MIVAAHRFRKFFKGAGKIGRLEPNGFPPDFPSSPCGPLGKRKPGEPHKPITKQQLDKCIGVIEMQVRYTKKIYDRMCR